MKNGLELLIIFANIEKIQKFFFNFTIFENEKKKEFDMNIRQTLLFKNILKRIIRIWIFRMKNSNE